MAHFERQHGVAQRQGQPRDLSGVFLAIAAWQSGRDDVAVANGFHFVRVKGEDDLVKLQTH